MVARSSGVIRLRACSASRLEPFRELPFGIAFFILHCRFPRLAGGLFGAVVDSLHRHVVVKFPAFDPLDGRSGRSARLHQAGGELQRLQPDGQLEIFLVIGDGEAAGRRGMAGGELLGQQRRHIVQGVRLNGDGRRNYL
ncbi:MAG TPA: hypothetical protein VLC74_07345 [Rhizomicrobium sp.]|nr:hypothetical protein [Rhizomicrobium sp.]